MANKRHIEILENREIKLDDSLFKFKAVPTLIVGGVSIFNKSDSHFVLNAKCEEKDGSHEFLSGIISCKYGFVPLRKLRTGKQTFKSALEGTEFVYSIGFNLSRKGECTLFGFKKNPSAVFLGKSAATEEYLASQAYMFLRDLIHRHKHHHPSSDTIIDIKPDDEKWAFCIACDLGKQVIKQPISQMPSTLLDAQGILSYLESFQTSFFSPESANAPPYSKDNITALRGSLDAEFSKLKRHLAERRAAWALVIGFVTFLGRYTVLKDGINHFGDILFLLLLVTLFIAALRTTEMFNIDNSRIVRNLFKIAPRKKIVASILFFGVFLASTIFAVYIWSIVP